MLKELRKITNRNADHCNKEQETIKMNQSKLDHSVAKKEINLKAKNSGLNNAEERISYLADRIMEITQSEQMKKNESNI